MKRILVPLLAVLIASAPVAAAAQDGGRRGGRDRDDRSEQTREEEPRVSVGQAVARASAGRPGRFLGARDNGGTIVVRWEYPGGRVADIMVDARSGRVVGER